jgi:hypothetical protein
MWYSKVIEAGAVDKFKDPVKGINDVDLSNSQSLRDYLNKSSQYKYTAYRNLPQVSSLFEYYNKILTPDFIKAMGSDMGVYIYMMVIPSIQALIVRYNEVPEETVNARKFVNLLAKFARVIKGKEQIKGNFTEDESSNLRELLEDCNQNLPYIYTGSDIQGYAGSNTKIHNYIYNFKYKYMSNILFMGLDLPPAVMMCIVTDFDAKSSDLLKLEKDRLELVDLIIDKYPDMEFFVSGKYDEEEVLNHITNLILTDINSPEAQRAIGYCKMGLPTLNFKNLTMKLINSGIIDKLGKEAVEELNNDKYNKPKNDQLNQLLLSCGDEQIRLELVQYAESRCDDDGLTMIAKRYLSPAINTFINNFEIYIPILNRLKNTTLITKQFIDIYQLSGLLGAEERVNLYLKYEYIKEKRDEWFEKFPLDQEETEILNKKLEQIRLKEQAEKLRQEEARKIFEAEQAKAKKAEEQAVVEPKQELSEEENAALPDTVEVTISTGEKVNIKNPKKDFKNLPKNSFFIQFINSGDIERTLLKDSTLFGEAKQIAHQMYFDAQDPTLKDPKIGEKILNNLAKRVKIYNVKNNKIYKAFRAGERFGPIGPGEDNALGYFASSFSEDLSTNFQPCIFINSYHHVSDASNVDIFRNLGINAETLSNLTGCHEIAHLLHFIQQGGDEGKFKESDLWQADAELKQRVQARVYLTDMREIVARVYGNTSRMAKYLIDGIENFRADKLFQEAILEELTDDLGEEEWIQFESLEDPYSSRPMNPRKTDLMSIPQILDWSDKRKGQFSYGDSSLAGEKKINRVRAAIFDYWKSKGEETKRNVTLKLLKKRNEIQKQIDDVIKRIDTEISTTEIPVYESELIMMKNKLMQDKLKVNQEIEEARAGNFNHEVDIAVEALSQYIAYRSIEITSEIVSDPAYNPPMNIYDPLGSGAREFGFQSLPLSRQEMKEIRDYDAENMSPYGERSRSQLMEDAISQPNWRQDYFVSKKGKYKNVAEPVDVGTTATPTNVDDDIEDPFARLAFNISDLKKSKKASVEDEGISDFGYRDIVKSDDDVDSNEILELMRDFYIKTITIKESNDNPSFKADLIQELNSMWDEHIEAIKKDRDQDSIGLMIYVARDFIKSLPSDSKLRSKIADLLSSGKIFANL